MAEVIKLEELSVDEAVRLARERGIVIVPIATTESHGNHLPLATDTLFAEYIGRELSKKTGLPAMVPTPLRLGCSPTFHYDIRGDQNVGTLAVSHATLQQLVLELCRGLYMMGFRKVVFIQAHGQPNNMRVICHEVATQLRREGKALFLAGATYWELARQHIEKLMDEPFFHADQHETSCCLHVRPDLVKLEGAFGARDEPLIDRSLTKRSGMSDETETFSIWDVASYVAIPEPGEVHHGGKGSTVAISASEAGRGEKALARAVERYLDLIRDLERHYHPQEVPGVDVRARRKEPLREVSY